MPYQEFTFSVANSNSDKPALVQPIASERFSLPTSGEVFKVFDNSASEYTLYAVTTNASNLQASASAKNYIDQISYREMSMVQISNSGGMHTFSLGADVVLPPDTIYKVCKKAYNVAIACTEKISSWFVQTALPNEIKIIVPLDVSNMNPSYPKIAIKYAKKQAEKVPGATHYQK